MKTKLQEMRELLQQDRKLKEPIAERMAVGMAQRNQLRTSRCECCGCQSEQLVPVVMNLCRRCGTRIANRVGHLTLKTTKVDFKGYRCDWCGTKVFKYAMTNPEICGRCMMRFGGATKREND